MQPVPIEQPIANRFPCGKTRWIWAGLLGIGLFLLVTGAAGVQRMLSCQSWPTASGTVVGSTLKPGLMREGSFKYDYEIEYRYAVAGMTYYGRRISYACQARGLEKVRELLKRYPTGALVTVHHHVARPALAVLETEVRFDGFKRMAFGLIMSLLTGWGYWRRWPLTTDYFMRPRDPGAPLTCGDFVTGALGGLTCMGIVWMWWQLIKMYAGR